MAESNAVSHSVTDSMTRDVEYSGVEVFDLGYSGVSDTLKSFVYLC